MNKKPVVVGLVGGGYASTLHGNGYKRVSGVDVRLKTIVDIDVEKAQRIADQYGFEKAVDNFDELLADEEIDVIDIVTPPALHEDMIIKALKAGKHVICEKPLSGYFGEPDDQKPIGKKVSKSKMYGSVLESMDKIKKVVEESEAKFMYAENYVYCTPVQKSAELIRAKKSKILFAKGEESLKGSSSPVAGRWDMTGGGTVIRVACHPLSGILWLKQEEAKARGEEITIKSVVADVGVITDNLTEHEKRHIAAAPEDVEDIGTITITFSDGTKALIISADVCLGGTKNYIELYCNDANFVCNITPTDILNTYYLDEDGIEDISIAEMLPSKLGWNKAFVSDEVIRGYTGQLQDFMECIAFDREPQSGFDLAYDSLKVIYAAYVSAEEGRRVDY
ncbi:MAG: Gfo/Idh/MocA family oxidoreductase [Marinisporobacter sp.]|jgi:predicted dehydrogenase|nr:Gfo/Idh/MocA family oxidoreductase [Marinisporobacter sp.]